MTRFSNSKLGEGDSVPGSQSLKCFRTSSCSQVREASNPSGKRTRKCLSDSLAGVRVTTPTAPRGCTRELFVPRTSMSVTTCVPAKMFFGWCAIHPKGIELHMELPTIAEADERRARMKHEAKQRKSACRTIGFEKQSCRSHVWPARTSNEELRKDNDEEI